MCILYGVCGGGFTSSLHDFNLIGLFNAKKRRQVAKAQSENLQQQTVYGSNDFSPVRTRGFL
jgi:hypothetical protein